MAKRGRKPGGSKVDDLPAALLESIATWADSHRNHSAVSIYRHFDLVGRGISISTFRRWLKERRADNAERDGNGDAPRIDRGPSPEDLVLSLLVERAETGDPKHFAAIGSALRALCDYRRLGFEQAAERRAQELHAEKMAELLKQKEKADRAFDKIAVKGGIPPELALRIKQLYGVTIEPIEREDVFDMIDDVMRGNTDDAA